MHRRKDLPRVKIGKLSPPDGGDNRGNRYSLEWAGWWNRLPNLGNRCHIPRGGCSALTSGILEKVANSLCHNHPATGSGAEVAGAGDR